MKTIFSAVAGVAIIAASSSAFSQITLPTVWKMDGGSNAWFSGSDNNTRGFDVDTTGGKVLVADRTPTNIVRIVNAATGIDEGTIPDGPYVSGTFIINKVNVAADGIIYVSNLAAATSTFKVYRHANITSTATLSYLATATPVRLGDDAMFRGAGNNTRGYVAGSTNNSFLFLTTTDGGLSFAGTTMTSSLINTGNPNIAVDPDSPNLMWYRQSGGTAVLTTASQTLVDIGGSTISLTGVVSGFGVPNSQGMDVGRWTGGAKFVAFSNGSNAAAASTGFRAFINTADTNTTTAQTQPLEKVGGSAANGNGAGNVRFYPSADRLFVLITNNSLSAHGLTVSSAASDWNLYDM